MKHLKLLTVLVWISASAMAQNEEPGGSRWFGGGNFGLAFGNYTFINVSPQVGYRFTKHLAAGGGINFQYISDRTRVNGETVYKSQRGVGGLNIFGRVYPIPQFMVQAQPEANYVWGKDRNYVSDQEFKFDSRLVPSLLLGGGVVLPAGRSALILSVFYDVLQNEGSPYGRRPIVNFGYNFGL